jgi:hypothetical protein
VHEFTIRFVSPFERSKGDSSLNTSSNIEVSVRVSIVFQSSSYMKISDLLRHQSARPDRQQRESFEEKHLPFRTVCLLSELQAIYVFGNVELTDHLLKLENGFLHF